MKKSKSTVTIRGAAELTGLTAKAIRYYEKEGVLPEPKRNESGYRHYTPEHIARLQKIKYYRDLHFGTKEIKLLLSSDSQIINNLFQAKNTEIKNTLRKYQQIYDTIQRALCDDIPEHTIFPQKNRTVVITSDLQKDILPGGKMSSRRILDILPRLALFFDQVRKFGIPVIYLCDWHYPDDEELIIWVDHMMANSEGAEIIDEVKPKEGDFVIRKNRFNGFVGTSLQNVLNDLNAQTLIFTGWRSHVCVSQTAIEAYHRGYDIIIAEDGVNTTTEDEHRAGMDLLGVNYGFEIIPCDEIIAELEISDKQI